MRFGRLILAALLCGLLAAPAWAGVQEEVAAAVAARERHDYATASRIITRLIRGGKLPAEVLGGLHGMRGVIWQEQREYYRAIADFTRATQLVPEQGEPHNNLAWIMATCADPEFRNGEQALKHARKAVELLKENPDTLDTLAAAQAEAGQLAEAVATMERVVAWCQEKGDTARLEQYRPHLEAYRQGQPWRDVQRRP